MTIFDNSEIFAGAGVGVVVLSALFVSRLFRSFALAAAALALVKLYMGDGIPALLTLSRMIQADLTVRHPLFTLGMLSGAGVVVLVALAMRERSVQ